MNGVLWYITFEVRIYLIWILIKTLKLFDTKIKANITLLILLIWVIARPELMPFLGSDGTLYGMVDFPQYTITFILGALLYLNEDELHISWWHVAVIIPVMWIFRHSTVAIWIWAVGYVVMAMVIGTDRRVFSIKVRDLSYGIFLYGWPTGQLVYEMMPNASALLAAIVTGLLATVMAVISDEIVKRIGACINKIGLKKWREEHE